MIAVLIDRKRFYFTMKLPDAIPVIRLPQPWKTSGGFKALAAEAFEPQKTEYLVFNRFNQISKEPVEIWEYREEW